MFQVTKTFIGGALKGITIVEKTSVKYAVGFVCKKPIGGSPYRIDAVSPDAS